MIWFIDEYLDAFLREMKLCPGVDISIETPELDGMSVCVYFTWHSPSLNVGWFPVCQIECNDRTVFHKEGAEDPETWPDFMDKAADALASAMTKGE